MVQRSLVATGGTVLASKLAIKNGVACNTAGGSHHANYDGGAGYCVFNDVAVAAQYLLRSRISWQNFNCGFRCSSRKWECRHI